MTHDLITVETRARALRAEYVRHGLARLVARLRGTAAALTGTARAA
ncbi:RSP_7527 family protein [Jannaschia sp. KMU-145]